MVEDRTGVVARLDALEAAHKAATEGPWEVAGGRRLTYDNGAHEDVVAVRVNHKSGPWERIYVKRDVDGYDAAAIVAEHNATPALIAAVRGVLALADELDLRADAKGSHPMPGYDEGYRAGLSDGEGYAADRLRTVVAAALGEA